MIKNLLERKKIILIFLGVILILLFIFKPFGLLGGRNSAAVFKTVEVKNGDLSTSINASGNIEAENQATLSFLSIGRVTQINFQEGDLVQKGQIIVSLDTAEARETVAKTEANLHSAQSNLEKVLDDARLWRYGNSYCSTCETATQKNTREAAEMLRDSAYRDLQIAKKQLEWKTIITPFDGVISEIKGIEVGQNITAASGSFVSIVGTDKLIFKASVDEIDYSQLSLGQTGTIILDAYPNEKFTGQISKIGVAATKLSTGGAVILVELLLSNDLRLKSGLNGEVEFIITTKSNVLIIPRSTLRKDNGEQYVYVEVKNKAEKRKIEIGDTLGNNVEIKSGISLGDKVILGDIKK